jgi:hypothetical protein
VQPETGKQGSESDGDRADERAAADGQTFSVIVVAAMKGPFSNTGAGFAAFTAPQARRPDTCSVFIRSIPVATTTSLLRAVSKALPSLLSCRADPAL